jgi:hypothetical protein
MDKSIVDMSGGILIDDVASNLKLVMLHIRYALGRHLIGISILPDGCIEQ